jgi:FMN phosphatase YigB (HAD superfamily)
VRIGRPALTYDVSVSDLAAPDVIFLLDVDNTLLDNDAVVRDLHEHLGEVMGRQLQARYWQIFEDLRKELGYADYLGALQRYRVEHLRSPEILELSLFLVSYPFEKRLYPGALAAIEYLKRWGKTVILSDGDVVFQPRKIQRSGLWEAVNGNVLIYIHKEQMLADVEQRFPGRHYFMIDDKLHILAAIKESWGSRVTTIFPKQGHYAYDETIIATSPAADIEIAGIGDLTSLDLGAVWR